MSEVRAKEVALSEFDQSRRQFVQRVAYTAPLIATLCVMPSTASAASEAFTEQLTTSHHHNNNNHWW